MSNIKKTSSLLEHGQQGLGQLLGRVKEWDKINTKLANFIDPKLWRYCRAGGMHENELVIVAANGSIAAQIRFQSTDLLIKFKADPTLRKIEKIHCKVIPSFAYSAGKSISLREAEKLTPLSQVAATVIGNIAESIQDPRLREVMLRLASRTK